MPNSHRIPFALMIAMVAINLSCSAPCQAESYSEKPIRTKDQAAQTDAPLLQGASCGTIGPQSPDTASPTLEPELPPMLPGATNGTIGPPGLDATYVAGTDRAGNRLAGPKFASHYHLLFSAFALSVSAWGLRLMLRKKKAPIWVLGTVVGSIIMVLGLAWHLIGTRPSCH